MKPPAHKEYKPHIKLFSRELRKQSTEAEKLLWAKLKSHQLGVKFRRQQHIDSTYIADFVSLEKRLIIELDGGQHCLSDDDKTRDLYLKEQKFRVIRFWNNEILTNITGCLEVITIELHRS
jgi:very-short-patch-repair endonuclease